MNTTSSTTTSRKRPHSPPDTEPPASNETAIPPTITPIRALLLHFNTLISGQRAISHVIRKTLSTVLPAANIRQPLLDEHIVRAFASSPAIANIVRQLALRDLTADETARLAECYSRIYYEEGTPLVRLAAGAREFLENVAALRERQEDSGGAGKMAVAVLSNNTEMAEDLLRRLGVRQLVDAVLPSRVARGQAQSSMSDASASVWEQDVIPWFAEFCGSSNGGNAKTLLPEQAVVVSCAAYDLAIAKAIGCKTCWMRKIDPDTEIAVRAAAEFPCVVETLGELWTELFAERLTEGNEEQGGEKQDEGEHMEEMESDYEQETWIL
ncbi:hypothetical protein C8A03DRAFT_38786 [Achaetomium macrosporum]|uniref:HAD-like protein n=1 Tax=Achaetomium macrosporum TaxID=79813 RepID=A0AAN7C1B0_9PEZI|nr:hypothetical protein C8A03DRAFT_38786 [Achaetomium macrosporum]